VFENRVLRRIFGPEGDDVTREWKMLHGEGLHNLYYFLKYHYADQVKEDEVGRACGTHRDERKVHGFSGKAQRKETTRKTDVWVGGWDHDGSWGDWLGVVE
jgi:hypothetical protein